MEWNVLNENLVDICWSIIDGNLSHNISFKKQATVCKYLAPEGYPTNPKKDQPIKIDKNKLNQIGAKYYYASVYRENNNIYTTTSRAMGILGIADDIQKAEQIAEQGIKCVEGQLFHRKDIGTLKLLQKRIDHMNSLLTN